MVIVVKIKENSREVLTKSSKERDQKFDKYWRDRFGDPHDRIYKSGEDLMSWLKEVIEDEVPRDILL